MSLMRAKIVSWSRWRNFWLGVEPYRRAEAASSRYAKSSWTEAGRRCGMRCSMPVVVERVEGCWSLKSWIDSVADSWFVRWCAEEEKRVAAGCKWQRISDSKGRCNTGNGRVEIIRQRYVWREGDLIQSQCRQEFIVMGKLWVRKISRALQKLQAWLALAKEGMSTQEDGA